jgi:hypothetical protein
VCVAVSACFTHEYRLVDRYARGFARALLGAPSSRIAVGPDLAGPAEADRSDPTGDGARHLEVEPLIGAETARTLCIGRAGGAVHVRHAAAHVIVAPNVVARRRGLARHCSRARFAEARSRIDTQPILGDPHAGCSQTTIPIRVTARRACASAVEAGLARGRRSAAFRALASATAPSIETRLPTAATATVDAARASTRPAAASECPFTARLAGCGASDAALTPILAPGARRAPAFIVWLCPA